LTLTLHQSYLPTTNDYVRPSETISFEISVTTADQVTCYIDFNDARSPHTMVTTDLLVAHTWPASGNYSVVITCTTCCNEVTKVMPVQITGVEEGVPPENCNVKVDIDRPDTAADYCVTAFLQAYSPRQKSCTVDFGDQEVAVLFDQLSDRIFNVEQPHCYTGLGFYAVSLTCRNDFGECSESAVAVGAEPGCRYQNHAKGENLVLPVVGADDSVGSVDGFARTRLCPTVARSSKTSDFVVAR